ncbi:hypothetical protein [Oryzihumus sp.]|uniref:hypothetical protein n=1 Tax=Oryzihumus sp. TaxID=1968903 RepID=UPI002EDB5791
MIPSDGSPLTGRDAQQQPDRDHLVRMVAACLSAGVVTVAEISGRSEAQVRALIAERTPHLHLLGERRHSAGRPPGPAPDADADGTARAS